MSIDAILAQIKRLELSILAMQSGQGTKDRKKRGTSGHRERVLRVIASGGAAGVSGTVLIRSTTNIGKEEREGYLAELIGSGQVLKTVTKPTSDRGGRPTICYRLNPDWGIVTIVACDSAPIVLDGVDPSQIVITQDLEDG